MFQFKYFKIPKTLSRDYCEKVLHALEKTIPFSQSGIIHLIAIDATQMAQMNQQYRGKEGATDILTFSYIAQEKVKEKEKQRNFQNLDSSSRPPILKKVDLAGMTGNLPPEKGGEERAGILGGLVMGEIYLCLEKIKIYAKERGVTYREQLEYIVVHGLVHLMGYDHETEEDASGMDALEQKILSLVKGD